MIRKLLPAAFILIMLSGCSEVPEVVPEDPGKVIVLMYHRIVAGEPANLYERSIEDFESDIKYLINNKIEVIGFDDIERLKAEGRMPAGNKAILTFDDGDNSWYNLVKPMLLKYRMKGTFFLWTYMIGHDSFMTWEEVEDMAHYTLKDGTRPFIFGSHSFSHSYLFQRKFGFATQAEYNAFLDYEMGQSKAQIELHTPGSISLFSLPYGDGAGDTEIISAAQRNGYKFIRTSVWGAIDNTQIDLFEIPSLPVLDATEQDLIGEYLGI